MVDEIPPVRRSLRVAGMTPLRPMSSIMFTEQNRIKSPSKSKGKGMTTTPKRNPQVSSILQPVQIPDSRARQVMNLPSDISSSDFLGDTPTARFHRAPAQGLTTNAAGLDKERGKVNTILDNTVIARRTNQMENFSIGAQTVRARRTTTKQIPPPTTNVFASSSSSTNEEGGGLINVILLSLRRILDWLLLSISKAGGIFVRFPISLVRKVKVPPHIPVRISGYLLIVLVTGVILYALSQLDLKVARGIGFSVFRTSPAEDFKSPNVVIPMTGSTIIPDSKIITHGDSKWINRKLLDLENLIVEAQLSLGMVKEDLQVYSKSYNAKFRQVDDDKTSLNFKLSTLTSKVSEISQKLSEYNSFGIMEKWTELSNRIGTIEGEMLEIVNQIVLLGEKVGEQNLYNLVKSQVLTVLPQNLLIRRESDGSIFLDSDLLHLLQEIFQERKGGGNTIAGGEAPGPASSPSSLPSDHVNSINLRAVESILASKLSQLQHKVADRDEVSDMIAKKLTAELSKISLERKEISDSIDKKLSRVGESLEGKQEHFRVDIMNFITKEWSKKIKDFSSSSSNDYGVDMADYALETMGSRIVTSKTSPSFYNKDEGWLTKFFHLSVKSKPPRVALSADNSLGNCWAFNGGFGNFTIALGSPIIPTHFSIDHIPASLGVDRSSAPKNFIVYGLESLSASKSRGGGGEEEAFQLGQYEYKLDNGGGGDGPSSPSPIQTFPAQLAIINPIRFIKLSIISNHGNPYYTCLYRFRVHSSIHSDLRTVYNDLQ